MSIYENILISDNEHELLVQIGFEDELSPTKIRLILEQIAQMVNGYEAEVLDFDLIGISSLNIYQHTLKMNLRFTIGDLEIEDLNYQKANFIMFLFAHIDKIHPIKESPFPSTFRDLIDLKGYYGL